MCFGSPKPSNAAASEAKAQAAEARLRDDQRAQRIKHGQEQVNRLFDRGETFTQGAGVPAADVINPTDPRWVGMTPDQVRAFKAGPWGAFTDTSTAIQPAADQTGAGSWNKTTGAFDADFYSQRRQTGLNYYVPQLVDQFGKAREQMAYALARAGLSRSTVAGEKANDLQGQYDIQSQTIGSQVEGDVNGLRSRVEDARSGLMSSLAATADPEATATQALGRAQTLQSEPVNYSPLGDIFAGLTGTIGAGASGYRAAETNALLNNALGGTGGTRPRNRSAVIGG